MDVKLPNLGEGADSGSVVSLLVKEGDEITKGQNIIELENGKAVVAIPSSAAGRVEKIRVQPGDKISVGQVILSLAGASATPAPAKSESQDAQPSRPSKEDAPAPGPDQAIEDDSESATAPPSPFPPPASPSIRRLARDLGIDLHKIRGTEQGGRIVMADLKAYVQRLQKLASKGMKAPPEKAAAPAAQSIDFAKWGPVERQALTPLRKMISQRMVESWTTIPHVTQFDDADISLILEARKKHASAFEAQGARLTVTGFILKAVVETLKKHPLFNSSIDETKQEVVIKNYFHLGLAVDTDAGLIVPVIRDVDKKNLVTLSKELQELAIRTRERKVTLEELSGGTFTISNQGGIGGAHFTPIINKPEVAILGVGRGIVKPAVKSGRIEAATLLPLCLSYDHRLIDGGQAARFIKDLLHILENFPEELIQP
jgi:pyruvate dehydrogenase E2 component (dihydrolipoamide acetyltransferase)